MRLRLRRETGQLLLPMAGLLLVFGMFLVGYVRWCRAIYWRTRMELVADATALSAARAQAEMLNRIGFANGMLNVYIQQFRAPYLGHRVGVIHGDDFPSFKGETEELANRVKGFKSYPPSVGRVVARANGAEGLIPYFPFPMESHLAAQTVHLLLYFPHPPWIGFKTVENAFYARTWSPHFRKAQPPHRTTWLVRRNGFQAMASARLWLDVPTSSIFHNGGFPREKESLLGGIGIQCQYPQFNARLAPKAKFTPQDLFKKWSQRRGASDEG